MYIETKFNVGDEIFFIHNKKCLSSIVRGMAVEVDGVEKKITCFCAKEENEKLRIKVDEQDGFINKDALLKSL